MFNKTNFTWLVDTHLHFYPCYNLKSWLDSMFANFFKHRKKLCLHDDFKFAAFLTERESENYFEEWKKINEIYDYQFEYNQNLNCLEISKNGATVYIYPGRQYKTLEGLEVLILGDNNINFDKINLSKTLEILSEFKNPIVIPWSFGKWLGSRFNTIKNALKKNRFKNLFLGDIYGRPNCCKGIEYLKLEFSLLVLAGTDPLPLSTYEYLYPASLVTIAPGQGQFLNLIDTKNFIPTR